MVELLTLYWFELSVIVGVVIWAIRLEGKVNTLTAEIAREYPRLEQKILESEKRTNTKRDEDREQLHQTLNAIREDQSEMREDIKQILIGFR